jgi:hypothetical protein
MAPRDVDDEVEVEVEVEDEVEVEVVGGGGRMLSLFVRATARLAVGTTNASVECIMEDANIIAATTPMLANA